MSTVLSLLGLLIYTVLNTGYVWFYEPLGIAPESIGFDRSAVLARTAALLPLMYAAGYALFSAVIGGRHFYARDAEHDYTEYVVGAAGAVELGLGVSVAFSDSEWLKTSVWALGSLILLVYAGKPTLGYRKAVPFLVGAIVAMSCASLQLIHMKVQDRLAAVQHQSTVGPVGLWRDLRILPVIDVRAGYATATWLDPARARPAALDDPLLVYLGRGASDTFFVACGTTLTIPNGEVSVARSPERHASPTSRSRHDQFCRASGRARTGAPPAG